MRLHELVSPLVDDARLRSLPNVPIREVTALSKSVRPGSLFIAVRGTVTDGHRFVEEAIGRGAAAIIGEFPDETLVRTAHQQHPEVPMVQVADARQALVEVGQRFYDYPATKLRLIGVTGTNGKTTTSFIVDHLLRRSGARVGLIGTVAYRCGERSIPSWNTTPGQLELQSLLAQMARAHADWCVMEVSSHALAQRRVEGLSFSRAVFTNLGSDHLDYHGSRGAYFETKCRLFDMLGPGGRAVINVDDSHGRELFRRLAARNGSAPRLVTFGLASEAALRASHCETSWSGTTFQLDTPRGSRRLTTRLLGVHNVANILAAVGCVLDDPCNLDHIERGVAAMTGVPGRLELVPARPNPAEAQSQREMGGPGGQDFRVVVDYAHTEAALEAVLLTVRSLQPQRVLTVFGCGGNRDRTKRPAMGRVAGRLSDFVCITSDNPRQEDPARIAAEVVAGLDAATPRTVMLDRGDAIRTTLALARHGDCVVIAGKGHETYQVLRDATVPFDDRQVAAAWLRDHQRAAP